MDKDLWTNTPRTLPKDLGCLRCESALSASGAAWTFSAPDDGVQKLECACLFLVLPRSVDLAGCSPCENRQAGRSLKDSLDVPRGAPKEGLAIASGVVQSVGLSGCAFSSGERHLSRQSRNGLEFVTIGIVLDRCKLVPSQNASRSFNTPLSATRSRPTVFVSLSIQFPHFCIARSLTVGSTTLISVGWIIWASHWMTSRDGDG